MELKSDLFFWFCLLFGFVLVISDKETQVRSKLFLVIRGCSDWSLDEDMFSLIHLELYSNYCKSHLLMNSKKAE